MIAVIDYGRGNLFSLTSALKYLGVNFKLVEKGENLDESFNKIILPGVGAFADAMEQLNSKKFVTSLQERHENKTPILGICLGMQLFATRSFEFLKTEGLNFIPGEVRKLKLSENYNIPNMGWRKLKDKNKNINFDFSDKVAYFVHSYAFYTENKDHITSSILLGSSNIPAIVRKDNVIGFQFHPEKSGKVGLNMLEWYIKDFHSQYTL